MLIRTTTQLDKNDYEKLKEVAYKQKKSIANIIRTAVQDYLKKDLTA